MFVSSYNTYIHTNTTDKSSKNKEEKTTSFESSFSSKLLKKTATDKILTKVPVDFVANNRAHNTKTQIQQQIEKTTKNNPITKFITMSSQMKAPSAYAANTTMFSLMINNQQTLKQDNKRIDQNLPQDVKEIKESFLRNKMVNTYIANNNYYQITA